MRRRGSLPRRLLIAAALLAAGLIGSSLLRHGEAPRDGELWRRGWLSGDQLRLHRDGGYALERWCVLCRDTLVESGTWARFGQSVSLVPSGSATGPRALHATARDGKRYLGESGPGRAASDPFERVE